MAIVHQIFATISEDTVQSVRVYEGGYEEANLFAKCGHGENAYAVDCRLVPCKIGDTYKNGIFYRTDENGIVKELPFYPDYEQEIKVLNEDLQTMAECQIDLESKLAYHELINI